MNEALQELMQWCEKHDIIIEATNHEQPRITFPNNDWILPSVICKDAITFGLRVVKRDRGDK